jgi:hypothetical protein
MKKLYLLILLLLAGAGAVRAQRLINLQLASNEAPGKSYVGMKNNYRTDTMMVKITNNGPDTVSSSDTVFIYSKFLNKRFYWTLPGGLKPGSSVDTYYYFRLTDEGYAQSQTLTNYNWCDSIYLVVPTDSVSDTNAANDVACHAVNLSIFSASIENMAGDNSFFSIYPNPAVDDIKFRFDFGLGSNAIVTIHDLMGRPVYDRNLGKHLSGKQEYSIATGSLANGIYFLVVDADNRRSIARFSIQR